MRVPAAISVLEGLVGTYSSEATQSVSDWAQMVKYLLRTESFRDLDDIQVSIVPSITDVGIVVSTDATHLIADCWEISGDLGTDTAAYCGFTDADSDTIDITVAMSTSEDVITIFAVNDLATAGISEYYPHIYLAGSAGVEATPGTYARTGIGLTTGLTAWADGKDGNAATAASVRTIVVFRT